jgi:ABC-2 type transport system permease protein
LTVLRRLVQLWLFFGYLDMTWMVRDLRSFAGYAFAEIIAVLSGITAMLLLAERFDGMGPWTQSQVVFLLGYAVTVSGLQECVFGFNIAFISRRIGRGQLDHMLVQPQPLWMTMVTEGFSPAAGFPILLSGLVLLGWGAVLVPIVVTPAWVGLFLVNVLGSWLILFSFAYIVGSLAFWAPRAAEEINSSSNRLIMQLRTFPLDGVSPLMLVGLMSVVPAGFIAWQPARALLGLDASLTGAWLTPLSSIAFAAIALLIFRTGLTHYAHTGSQRYLSYGHRR